MAEEPQKQDLLGQIWYAVENDLIGGWSLTNADRPCSQLVREDGEHEIASFVEERMARHMAAIHNGFIEDRQDFRLQDGEEAAQVRGLLSLGLLNGNLVSFAGHFAGSLVTTLAVAVNAEQARPVAILVTEAAWNDVMQASQIHSPMVDMTPPKRKKKPAPSPSEKLILPGHVKRKVRDNPQA